jgi:hypothetical protein
MNVVIEIPNQPRSRKAANWEKYGWLFMRVSGPLLIVLIFTHLIVNLVLGDGIKAIDFAFVAGKWADPFWQVWGLGNALACLDPRHQRYAHHRERLRREGKGSCRSELHALDRLCSFDCARNPSHLYF